MNGTDEKDGINSDNEIEAHLESCPECSRKKAQVDRMIASLKDNKEVFCPEIWRLHDFVQFGDDPSGEIAKHVAHCHPCADKVAELRAETTTQPSIAPALFQALKKEYPPPPSVWARLQEFLSTSFRLPILTVATAAAVVLVVVALYPREGTKPVIGLTSVSWDGNLKLMTPDVSPGEIVKPRMAMIIMLKGFEPKLPQDRIDDLYRALKPNKDLKAKYEFISPDEVTESIGTEKGADDTKKLAQKLNQELDISTLLMITLRPEGTAVAVETAIVHAVSGVTGAKKSERVAVGTDLGSTIKRTVLSLLDSAGH